VIITLQRAQPERARRLLDILALKTTDPALLAEAVEIMAASGTFDVVRQWAASYVDRAKEIAAGMGFLPESHRDLLIHFVDYVVSRNR
jgi:geranylgeranyl diphosphate synthase type I